MTTATSEPFSIVVRQLQEGEYSSTFHSIALEWAIGTEDADYDAVVAVEYRKVGDPDFKQAANLLRVDYQWFYSDNYPPTQPAQTNFAGSIMFLTPGTQYEIRLTYTDPDGTDSFHDEVRNFLATTRAIPVKPTGGNTYHVSPGSGGGDGSVGNPFLGLAEANANAQPGDIFLLNGGTYSGTTLDSSGGEDNHVVYQSAGTGTPVIDSTLMIEGDHIWIDGLSFVWDDPTGGATPPEDQSWTVVSGIAVPPVVPRVAPDDIVIHGCTFSGFFNGIVNFYSGSRWVVMDNTLVGTMGAGIGTSGTPGDSSGRGIAIAGESTPGGSGYIVAYNSITQFSDGMGAATGSDTYGNDIWDHQDDCCSTDSAGPNLKVWGNRFHECAGSCISFQPQAGSPWYFLYNQMADAKNGIWKWRVPDRSVFINNTFLAGDWQAHYFMRCYLRNNLFVSNGTGYIWSGADVVDGGETSSNRAAQFEPNWMTDLDYDGFCNENNSGNAYSWYDGTAYYADLAAFASAVGIYPNGLELAQSAIFENWSPAGSLPEYDHEARYTLASGANAAVDAGEAIPNLSDWHGSAPDLGAHQRGATPLHYGPRPGTELDQKENHWSKH